jgi:hypothetical protein
MKSFLTEDEYRALQQELSNGSACLQVKRFQARQFFTNVTSKEFTELTGKSNLFEKTVVLGVLLASIAVGVLCLLVITRNYGWAAMIAAPLVGIFWTIIVGFLTETGSALASIIITALALGAAYWLPTAYQPIFITFIVSIFLFRIAHSLAQYFLCRTLGSSYAAFDMLYGQIDIIRNAD